MNKRHPESCPNCKKEVYPNDNNTISFEDYKQTILHDQFKCYNFKHFKRQFEQIEDSLQALRQDVKKIQEFLF